MNPTSSLVLVLAILGTALAAPSHVEHNYPYVPPIGVGRIVGGAVTTIQEHPWQVALLRNGAQLCGGSIVANRIVLTAAHCVVPSIIPAISTLNVRTGSAQHNSGGLRIAASRVVIHENYQDCTFCAPDYDIAVIHLAADGVGSGVPASPIDLWEATTTFAAGTVAVVSGWGATSEGGAGSVQLRSVPVPVVANANCRAVYGSIITERTICAGLAEGGRDSCQGDSGGPFVIQNRLAGIVSFGSGCARPGLPGVYASIPGYRAWIRANAGL